MGTTNFLGVDGFTKFVAVVEMVLIMMVDDITGPKWNLNGDIEGWLNMSTVMYSFAMEGGL